MTHVIITTGQIKTMEIETDGGWRKSTDPGSERALWAAEGWIGLTQRQEHDRIYDKKRQTGQSDSLCSIKEIDRKIIFMFYGLTIYISSQ